MDKAFAKGMSWHFIPTVARDLFFLARPVICRSRHALSQVAMKTNALVIAILFVCVSCPAQETPQRPHIMGIGNVSIALPKGTGPIDFYIKNLGFGPQLRICRMGSLLCLGVGTHQTINLLSGHSEETSNNLAEVTFETSDVGRLRLYLESRGVQTGQIIDVPRSRHFSLTDPEGHHIGFIQYIGEHQYSYSENQLSSRIIHAGFVVQDRAAEDKFYKDILGFHVYWHGGMKEGEDNWVDMQVPDGTDWIEYMLRVAPDASHKTLGVMNHIALGVPDIHAAQQQLIKNGWKSTEEPKIGRDGKWQLNLYDPDETRVELMEFKPTKEPCCSAYTGPHPGPPQ